MKIFTKNAIIKKILIALVTVIMISNFIMPNYVCAEDDEEENEPGGKLFTPITELILGIADRVLATVQDIFVGETDWTDTITGNSIKNEINGDLKSEFLTHSGILNPFLIDVGVERYSIRYSPGVIFSGRVPGLDINFISPMSESESTFEYVEYGTKLANNGLPLSWKQAKENYGASGELQIQKGSTWSWVFTGNADNYYSFWEYNGKQYYFVFTDLNESLLQDILIAGVPGVGSLMIGIKQLEKWYYEFGGDSAIWGTLYEYGPTESTYVTKDSSAAQLQNQISKWYNALRTLALVGLLSVLVYVGIKIILSSNSAQNQAKYKSMLKDWLVAICILFVLHYIMAFVLDITSRITDLFTLNSVNPGGEDVLMTNIRNKITGETSYWVYFGYVVMYITLVILTITFTIEYLKRVVFIAFLTMIAPLIALTYPLDKIKDGQAQAFSIWIKEYVFNCLLQPVHLLLYTVFIDSASQLINVNPLYAIVTLAFFKPAEKFFRKMFGFDKASSISTLGAAAGGAMVMNMLNKIQGRSAKGKEGTAGSGANSSTGVRTATRNPSSGGNTPTANVPLGNNNAGGNGNQTGNNQTINNNTGNNQTTNNTTGNSQTRNMQANRQRGNTQTINSTTIPTPSRANGLKALGKKIVGPDALKSMGKWTLKNSIRAAGAFAGGTIGLAAGLADGDFELPIKNMAAGATIGAAGAQNITQNTVHGVKKAYGNISETYLRGKLGDEAYNNMQFDKAFYKSDVYKQITQDPSIDQTNIKGRVQEFLDNGITDGSKIREALQNDITGDELSLYNGAGITSTKDMKSLKNEGITPDVAKNYGVKDADSIKKLYKANIGPSDYEVFKRFGVTNVDKIARVKAKHSNLLNSQIASRMAIAENAKHLISDHDAFVRYATPMLGARGAEDLFNQIGDFSI